MGSLEYFPGEQTEFKSNAVANRQPVFLTSLLLKARGCFGFTPERKIWLFCTAITQPQILREFGIICRD